MSTARSLVGASRRVVPGVALCLTVTLFATLLERCEIDLFGRAWLESLVLAILLGAIVRTLWKPNPRFAPGIAVSAKLLLEIAVMLLGLSVSTRALVAAGPGLIAGIAVVVVIALALSYTIGRALGLSHKLAVLIACGNSICGNSAIAATAPIIHADSDDIAASIAFTAVLGVVVVLAVPPITSMLQLSILKSGILAGLTVYAVPQVLAATAPIGRLAVQMGTLVKLVRVLMLGPVVFFLALTTRDAARPARLALGSFVPWFIVGFLAMIGLRASGLVSSGVLHPVESVTDLLTVVAMAGLGLSVDVRTVAAAGSRVFATVLLSLLGLATCGFGLIAAYTHLGMIGT